MRDAAEGTLLAVAVLTAIGVLFRWARNGFKKYESGAELIELREDIKVLVSMSGGISELLQRELNHNHGSSMKDDAHGTAISVRIAHERIDAVETTLRVFADANHLVLPIIADAINAKPPTERAQL